VFILYFMCDATLQYMQTVVASASICSLCELGLSKLTFLYSLYWRVVYDPRGQVTEVMLLDVVLLRSFYRGSITGHGLMYLCSES